MTAIAKDKLAGDARPAAHASRRRSRDEPTLARQIVLQILCLIVLATVMFPIIWVFSVSLDPLNRSPPEGLSLIPAGASFEAYQAVLDRPTNNPISFLGLLGNSLKVSLGTALVSEDRTEIVTTDAPRGTGAYSQALRAGDFVFISGQGPLDPETLEVVGTTIEEQTEQTLRNLAAIAAAAGGSLGDVARVSAFLSSIELFEGFNATYGRIVDALPRPARTTTGAELRGILVEIDAVLYLPR